MRRKILLIFGAVFIIATAYSQQTMYWFGGSGNWKRSQTDRTTELFVPAEDAAHTYSTNYNSSNGEWAIVTGDTGDANRFMLGHELKLEVVAKVIDEGNMTNTATVDRPSPSTSNPPSVEPYPDLSNNEASVTVFEIVGITEGLLQN